MFSKPSEPVVSYDLHALAPVINEPSVRAFHRELETGNLRQAYSLPMLSSLRLGRLWPR